MVRKVGISIEIDRLTNSIVNAITGDILETEFHRIGKREIKKKDWLFDWYTLLLNKKAEVYKMTIKGNPSIIQGLISFELREKYIFVNNAESAKFNRGAEKVYEGIGGNLFAFACKRSLDVGFGGFVSFEAKTTLIDHYIKTLGAEILYGKRMAINDYASIKLINRYFKN
jgi:hypothetical protein